MKLNAEQREITLKLLQEKWPKNPVCPSCTDQKWTISDTLCEIREFHGGGFKVAGQIVPVIVVTCSNCGYTMLFNALALGLLKPEEIAPNE